MWYRQCIRFLYSRRVDYDRPSGQACRASRATQRVRRDKTDLGYLRRCDPPGTDCRKPKTGWTGAVERNDSHRRTQRLGFAGLSDYCAITQLEINSCQVDSFEAPLTVKGLQNLHNAFTGIFIRASICFCYPYIPSISPIKQSPGH